MKFPEVIIFDLDDTIVSFDAGLEPAWQEVCGRFAGQHPWCDSELLYKAIRKASAWYWSDSERHRRGRNDLHNARREVVMLALKELGVTDRSYACEIADDYSNIRLQSLSLFPGARKTLEILKARGQRMALLTNGESSLQRHKIDRFDLAPYFELICIEGETGFGKPEKRAYTNIMETLSLASEHLWMIGDNLDWDVRAPKELGIYSIWNDFKRKGLPPHPPVIPDRIIHSIKELVQY
jgi:putative hydrolase of the HAD superfamily